MNIRHWVIACTLTASLLMGCGSIPVKSEKIEQTDVYVAKTTLDSMVAAGTSRDEVLKQFGEPTVRGWQDGVIGYNRCVTLNGDIWTLVFGVPIPSFGDKDPITDCEFIGFWFDASGRLVKGDMKTIHGLMFTDSEGNWSNIESDTTWRPYYDNELKQWLGKNAP